MQKITSVSELKMAIRQLESDQEKQAELLKNQFSLIVWSLNPINLLNSTLKDILASPVVLLNGIAKIKSYFTA